MCDRWQAYYTCRNCGKNYQSSNIARDQLRQCPDCFSYNSPRIVVSNFFLFIFFRLTLQKSKIRKYRFVCVDFYLFQYIAVESTAWRQSGQKMITTTTTHIFCAATKRAAPPNLVFSWDVLFTFDTHKNLFIKQINNSEQWIFLFIYHRYIFEILNRSRHTTR